jgi:hypothetical protein
LGASTVFAYNFLFLLGMFLSAVAAWALARRVTGDATAALLGGMVFAFVPWRLAQIPHVQYQWGAFLALTLLFLLRWLDGGRRRDLVLYGVSFAWNALTNVHYAVFSGILLAVVLAWEALARQIPDAGRRIGRAIAATVAAAILVAPVYAPYAKAAKAYGMRRSSGEMRFYSARPSALLVAGPQNKLWGPITGRFARPEAEMFPGVVPVALAAWALLRLRRVRVPEPPARVEVPAGRRRAAAVCDALAVVSVVAFVAGVAVRDLRIGPLILNDPGRALVFATAFGIARLAFAFPRRAAHPNLGAWLASRRFDLRAGLFAAVGLAGLVVAAGGNTPYYRFLFQSFGFVFRAIRVPARGMVLFHLGLAVLAAWGVTLLRRRLRRRAARAGVAAAALVLTAIEYRASPIEFSAVDPQPAPVYRWLAGVEVPGAILEWPIGFDWDAEHELRSTAHWKRLVNGYSGFSPPLYDELKSLSEKQPVPDGIWEKLREIGTALLVLHPHESDGLARLNYARAARRALASGKLSMIGAFPHSGGRDFVFSIAPTPAFPTRISAEDRARAAAEFEHLTSAGESELAPPFGVVDVPAEDALVSAGSLGFGWALDDSGIAAIEVASELGPAGRAAPGGPRPDVAAAFPDHPGAERSGFNFFVPQLPAGPHTLSITLVATDGGRKVLTRRIRIVPPPDTR